MSTIFISGIPLSFNIDGVNYDLMLYPITPLKAQTLLDAEDIANAQRFTVLDEKKSLKEDERVEYDALLSKLGESTQKVIVPKLKLMVHGVDSKNFIDKLVEIGQEETALNEIESVLKEQEELKKK